METKNTKQNMKTKPDLNTVLNNMAFIRPCFKVFRVEDTKTNSLMPFPQIMMVITKDHKLKPIINSDPLLSKLPYQLVDGALELNITAVKTFPDRNVMFTVNKTHKLTCEPHVSVWVNGKYEVISIKREKI